MANPAWAGFFWSALDRSIGSATKKSYSSGWNHWRKYCARAGTHPSTQEVEHFCFFIGFLRAETGTRAFSSYKKCFAAIRAVHLAHGLPEPWDNKPTLGRALLGLKKMLGTGAKRKLPLTVDVLRSIRPHFNFGVRADVVVWDILVTAVFGLLRLGEVTATATNDGQVAQADTVTAPDPAVRYIQLDRSKTDPFACEDPRSGWLERRGSDGPGRDCRPQQGRRPPR